MRVSFDLALTRISYDEDPRLFFTMKATTASPIGQNNPKDC